MSTKYKFHDPDGTYFLSIALVYWLDVFTRKLYKDIIVDSLSFCVKEKGLVLNAYVIMSNHIHLIVGRQSDEYSISDILRDFKKYTAMHCIKAIKENPQESRREWLLWMMERAGKKNSNNTKYQFWQQDNHPIELHGGMIEEKLNYIHNNPVEEGWVNEAQEYYYSSARNYGGLESPIKITSVYDGKEI
jgi:putative transposase